MSNIKFSQLPDLGTITANTIVPVVSANTNFTVTAANLQTFVNTSAGNISGGNVLSVGVVSAGGNITGNYILGNGSQLTGLPALYGNANVVSLLAGFGSNTISTTGTVTAGNITGGNVLTGGVVSATGNITGNYILGNGSALTGLPAGYSNANVVTLLASFGSNSISTTGNITASYFAGNGAGLTGITSNVVNNVISSGSNFANTAVGNGIMWINGGNAISGVFDPATGAANGLYILNGNSGARMTFSAGPNGNIGITVGNLSTGVIQINAGITIVGSDINGRDFTSTRTIQGSTVKGTAAAFGATAGFNATQLTLTSTSSGTAGDIAWDANYIYVCTASNTWKRVLLLTF
jgi:hypothetical protein